MGGGAAIGGLGRDTMGGRHRSGAAAQVRSGAAARVWMPRRWRGWGLGWERRQRKPLAPGESSCRHKG